MSLAALDRAELARRIGAVTLARDRLLPVAPSLQPLFASGGVRRGTVVACEGSTWLALAVAAGPSAAGSWCAAVGMPWLGMVSAASLGCDLSRFALVANPGGRWTETIAALVDAMDVVLVAGAGGARAADIRRLAARARERGSVIVACGTPSADGSVWPDRVDVRLRVDESRWEGLGDGHGHLRRRWITVESTGRGPDSGHRRVEVAVG